MFIDRARIFVQSGKGGDGMSSFRHEKFVPKGGPNGGDGGQGGNVVLVADRNVNTLVDFRFRRLFKAKPGGKGEGSNKYGRNAEDLLITVPLGTIVKDEETGQVMADLSPRRPAGHRRQRRPRRPRQLAFPHQRQPDADLCRTGRTGGRTVAAPGTEGPG
jgi:Obg family GTPase CgtA